MMLHFKSWCCARQCLPDSLPSIGLVFLSVLCGAQSSSPLKRVDKCVHCGEKVFLLNIAPIHRQPITARGLPPPSKHTPVYIYFQRHSQAFHPFHTQLFELCITDFTKSCHLSRRLFLVTSISFVCNFFHKESQACRYHTRNRLHRLFLLV